MSLGAGGMFLYVKQNQLQVSGVFWFMIDVSLILALLYLFFNLAHRLHALLGQTGLHQTDPVCRSFDLGSICVSGCYVIKQWNRLQNYDIFGLLCVFVSLKTCGYN
jgi:hypothetical protein